MWSTEWNGERELAKSISKVEQGFEIDLGLPETCKGGPGPVLVDSGGLRQCVLVHIPDYHVKQLWNQKHASRGGGMIHRCWLDEDGRLLTSDGGVGGEERSDVVLKGRGLSL